MLKLCPICGKQFETTDGKRKYCGRPCAVVAKSRAQAKFNAAARDKARGIIAPQIVKTCAMCGKQLVAPQRKYCCDECRDKATKELQKEYRQRNAEAKSAKARRRRRKRMSLAAANRIARENGVSYGVAMARGLI